MYHLLAVSLAQKAKWRKPCGGLGINSGGAWNPIVIILLPQSGSSVKKQKKRGVICICICTCVWLCTRTVWIHIYTQKKKSKQWRPENEEKINVNPPSGFGPAVDESARRAFAFVLGRGGDDAWAGEAMTPGPGRRWRLGRGGDDAWAGEAMTPGPGRRWRLGRGGDDASLPCKSTRPAEALVSLSRCPVLFNALYCYSSEALHWLRRHLGTQPGRMWLGPIPLPPSPGTQGLSPNGVRHSALMSVPNATHNEWIKTYHI